MRDNQRLAKIRQLPCCRCGASPPSQACHSNFSEHGKGRGIKASDEFTVALCWDCHRKFDQFTELNREQSRVQFVRWLNKTNMALEHKDESAF